MGNANTKEHRPLVCGIKIQSIGYESHTPVSQGSGTLTGVATRVADLTKVLVANRHVMALDPRGNPATNTEMHQRAQFLEDRTITDTKVGDSIRFIAVKETDNEVDLATCDLVDGVVTKYHLHDATHSGSRKIIAGTIEPTDGLPLILMGAVGGERPVTVKHASADNVTVGAVNGVGGDHYESVVVLDVGETPVKEGDSGAACLYHVGNNEYKMCCIMFGGEEERDEDSEDDSNYTASAFKASVAEQRMGIRFGIIPPVARASAPAEAHRGDTVFLDGRSSYDQVGNTATLTYLWEQIDIGDGPTITLQHSNTTQAAFTVPDGAVMERP